MINVLYVMTGIQRVKGKRGKMMKKRQRMIAMFLSLAMVFGLCGSELAVQPVKAQEVQEVQEAQEVQEGVGDESQNQEETPKDESDKEIMEESGQEGEKSEKAAPEEKDREKSEKETVLKAEQKEIVPKAEETGNENDGSDGESDWDQYTLYYDSLINGQYYTSSGNFADGETVAMEIEASVLYH